MYHILILKTTHKITIRERLRLRDNLRNLQKFLEFMTGYSSDFRGINRKRSRKRNRSWIFNHERSRLFFAVSVFFCI